MSAVEVKIRILGDFRKLSEIAKDIEEKVAQIFGTEKAGITSFKVVLDEKELEMPSVIVEMNKVDADLDESIEGDESLANKVKERLLKT